MPLSLFPRQVSESRRVVTCCAAGALAASACAVVESWQLSLVVGWNATAIVMLWWLHRDVWKLDAEATQAFSTTDDESRTNAASVVILGSAASLAAVIVGVLNGKSERGALVAVTILASVLAVALAFAVVHSVFALRYLHAYFLDQSAGDAGIRFPDDIQPCASDFAYFAFTIGMSFAVSDAEATTPAMRRRVMAHALVSYAFASAILGFSINLFAGMLG